MIDTAPYQPYTLESMRQLAKSEEAKKLYKSVYVCETTKMCINTLTLNADILDFEAMIELPHMLYVAGLEDRIGSLQEKVKHYEGSQLPE